MRGFPLDKDQDLLLHVSADGFREWRESVGRSHCVLNVCRHIQEASNRIGFRSRLVEFWSDSDLECSGNYSNAGILIMKVVLPMAGRKEERISECFTRRILVAFQDRPLSSIRIRPLPNELFRVPYLYRWGLSKRQWADYKEKWRNENLQVFLRFYVLSHAVEKV